MKQNSSSPGCRCGEAMSGASPRPCSIISRSASHCITGCCSVSSNSFDHWPFCASAAWMAVSARLGLAVKRELALVRPCLLGHGRGAVDQLAVDPGGAESARDLLGRGEDELGLGLLQRRPILVLGLGAQGAVALLEECDIAEQAENGSANCSASAGASACWVRRLSVNSSSRGLPARPSQPIACS
jgi:hypothetical protein